MNKLGKVAVAVAMAFSAGVAFGGPKTWMGGPSGDWNVPENWDPAGVPGPDSDVTVAGADVTLTGPIDVNSLTVSDAAKLTVKAVGLSGEDLEVFKTLETDLAPIAAKLWERATIVNVRNGFTVEGGATVIPDADKVSGVPVIFKVGGDFTLGEDASFNAVNRGWGWTLGSTDLAGAKTNPGGTTAWTFAPGPGHAYNYGGGYGGDASCPQENGGRRYGYAYGFSYAPFLPGSCSGLYTQTSADKIDGTRGGGAIVIFAEGVAEINGTMTAMSERHDYSSASGGSIWLTASSFTFGANARLTAKAADSQNYGWNGVGGGGRIALAEGYTWADIETAASGTVPEGFIEQPTIWPEIVDADVSKAACNDKTKNHEPNPGTLSYVRKADLPVRMMVTIDGEGSVAYDGTTYDESFEIDVPVNEALTLTATAADGNVFSAWYGDGLTSGGVAETEISYTSRLPFKLRVVFKSLTATDRAWTGAVSDDWNIGANWEPAGVPGPNDAVTISGAALGLTATMDLAALTLADGAALTVGAVSISLGGADARNDATLNIAGDLTVAGGSMLTVYANELADYSVFATLESDLAPITNALWNAAKIVTVGRDLTVTGTGSTVYPDAGYITGVPVFFKVGGNFTLGEGASFNAVERGWGWTLGATPPAYAKTNPGGSAGWNFAPGSGCGYLRGGGYGGDAAVVQTQNGHKYGYAYGCAVAPFLPGSCGGLYSQTGTASLPLTRGGGAIVVFAAGKATVNGTMNVSSVYHDHAGASGGAIYLAAQEFAFGADAALTAKGGNTIGYSGVGMGGGGRIAIAEGYTWDNFVAAASGVVPEGFRAEVEFPSGLVTTDVSGGDFTAGTSATPAQPGTLAFIQSAAQPVDLTVTIVGDGTVSYGGETYDKTFTVSVPTAQDLMFTAAPAEGARFISWGGTCIPGLFSEETELHLTLDAVSSVSVTFARGDFVRQWAGGASGSWESPVNWLPAGLPKAGEPVVVSNATVLALESVTVSNLTLKGGASLSVGDADERNAATLNIAGDLTVEGGSTLTVYARELEDLSVFADKATAAAAIWANRGVVKVGGRFSVSGGATVYPVNDPASGVPVVFEVGSFDLAADGTIDANGAGWRWQPVGSRTFPEGITKYTGAAKIDGTSYDSVFTLAFAPGSGYLIGASHGGLGAPREGSVKPTYGYRAAPFLPGSPGGTHDKTVNVSNGGGTICILAKGAVRLEGRMTADAVQNSAYGGAAGGSVWIVAGQISQADTLTVTAKGCCHTSNANYKPGSGGRVAFVAGVDPTSDAFTELVTGGEPESLSYADLAFSGLSVAGARNGDTTKCIAADGTATQVFDASTFETLTVCGAPLAAVSTGVAYGDAQLLPGPVSYAVTDYGYDPADPANVRYSCGGWVVSNATELVAEDVTATAAFDIVKGEGPYTLTWQWTDRETRTVVTPAPALGVIKCGDAPILEEAVYWVRDDATLTLDAVPEEGCVLTTWRGVPRGDETVARQVLSGAEPHVVTAFFHDSASATTRYWKKGVDGNFYVAANWEGGVVPGFGDTAVVSNGTCRVTDRLQLAGLVVTNGATVRISNADVVTVADDLALYGSAKLYVTAHPLDETHTFATGTTRVMVGGTLSLAGTSTLYPESDAWSGSTVRFDVDDFELAAGASVNADNLGWGWLTYTGTPAAGATTCSSDGVNYQTIALGRGWDFGNGGSYGMKANSYSGPAYGWTNSVVHAGSPNGVYSASTYRGGGLIRIHAKGRTTVDGTLSADGVSGSVFGGPSGGGIWLTAKAFAFGDAAVLRARGGTANYSSNGSGGRIAIGVCTDERRIDELAETGTYPGLRKGRIHDEAFFRENVGNASMTIDVHSRPNASQVDKPGTFVYLDATRTGMMLLVK